MKEQAEVAILKKATQLRLQKNLERINILRDIAKIPEVGMGATSPVGSDSYPHTIVELSEDLGTIVTQGDYSNPLPGCDRCNQVYEYFPNTKAAKVTYTLRKNGYYVQKGYTMYEYSRFMLIGHRKYYCDPSF